MSEITNEQKEQIASFWNSMVIKEPQEFVVKEKYDELQKENKKIKSIINEIRKLAKERIKEVSNMSYVEMASKAYIEEQQELLEILDKVEENK